MARKFSLTTASKLYSSTNLTKPSPIFIKIGSNKLNSDIGHLSKKRQKQVDYEYPYSKGQLDSFYLVEHMPRRCPFLERFFWGPHHFGVIGPQSWPNFSRTHITPLSGTFPAHFFNGRFLQHDSQGASTSARRYHSRYCCFWLALWCNGRASDSRSRSWVWFPAR